jgi:hypothetical protein
VFFKLNATFSMEFNNEPDLSGKPQQSDYRRCINQKYRSIFTDHETKIGKTLMVIRINEPMVIMPPKT